MAFTTIPGGDLADIILLGSEAADTVVLNTSQSIIANGFGGDDSITIANPVAATGGNMSDFTAPSTIYGGEGNDSLLLGVYTVGSSAILGGAGNDFFGTSAVATEGFFDFQAAEANGNEGEDTFGGAGNGIRANGSQILGGANNDTIWVGTSTNTEFNGNKNLDRLNVIGDQTGGSVFGGKGIDFINTAATDGTIFYAGTSISGADGNDVISDSGITGITAGTTLTVLGGQGSDNIDLSLSGAATSSALVGGGTENDFITIEGTVVAGRLTVNGGSGDDVITAYGNISGGEGADSITANGASTFLYAMSSIATETGLSTTTIDSITSFDSANDAFKTGVAGTDGNFTASGATVTGFAAALNAANVYFTTAGNEGKQYYTIADDGIAVAGSGYIFFKDSTTSTTATAAIQIDAIATVVAGDFIA